jgi:hypothetical protein
MGLTFTTVCLKCGVSAPEVGDFGYIGLPSPDARKRRGDLQSFGFIYAGLAATERGLTEHGTLAMRREARRWLAGDPNR